MVKRYAPFSNLGDMLARHIGRHPYWYTSLAIHVVLIALSWIFFVDIFSEKGKYVDSTEQVARVEKSLQKTSQMEMQQRVQDMQKIKKLLEQSLGENNDDSKIEAKEDLLKEKTPNELMAEAKELSDAIKKIKNNEKAKELAKLLDIPEADALKKVTTEAEASNKKLDEENVNATDLAPLVEKLQEEAKDALMERQQQLERAQDGVKLASEDTQHKINTDAKNKEKSQSKESGEGKGEGSRGGSSKNKSEQAASGKGHGTGHGIGSGHGDTNNSGGSNANDGADHEGRSDIIKNKISTYLNGDIPLPQNISEGQGVTFEQGNGHIPALPNTLLHKRDGSVLGAGGEFTNRFYLNNWYIIGPFNSSVGAKHKYPPERAINLDAVYSGKNNLLVSWQYVSTNQYPLIPPNLQENAIYYGYTELMFDQECDLWAWVGADDDARIWLNDRMVFEGGNNNKGWYFDAVYFGDQSNNKNWNLTEAKQLMHFKKGRNKVLFRLANWSRHGFFSMVLAK